MQRQLTTEQIVTTACQALKASMYIRMPGAVVSYDPSTQLADVQPMINDVRFDLDTGAVVFEPWSVIRAVPVAWPRFGNGFVIAGFLEAQDQVILEAFDLDPSPWRQQGRSTNPVNPFDVRRLGGNYWSATPADLTGPIADPDVVGGASLVLGLAGGATLVVTGTTITLGQKATAVAIGPLPAPLAAGPGTATAVAALGTWCATWQSQALIAPNLAALAAAMVGPTATLATAMTTATTAIPTKAVTAGP